MRWSPGCDCCCTYTVRRYRPDGTTAWVRSFGGTVAPATRPDFCAVGSDGRVFVVGPRVADPDDEADEPYTLRCYDAWGETLWKRDVVAEMGFDPDTFTEWHDMDRDGANNVYVRGSNSAVASTFKAKFDADGNFVSWSTISNLFFRFSVTQSGVVYTPVVTSPTNWGDVAAWDSGISTASALIGGNRITPVNPSASLRVEPATDRQMFVDPVGPFQPDRVSGSYEIGRRIAGSESGALFCTGDYFWFGAPGGWPPGVGVPARPIPDPLLDPVATLASFDLSLTPLWFAPNVYPSVFTGPIGCTYDGSKLAAIMNQSDNATGSSPSALLLPSLAKLNGDGSLDWCHHHATFHEIGIGEDGTVAIVCGPRIRGTDGEGNREFDYLPSIAGALKGSLS